MEWVVLGANRTVDLKDCIIQGGFLLREGESEAGSGIFPFLVF